MCTKQERFGQEFIWHLVTKACCKKEETVAQSTISDNWSLQDISSLLTEGFERYIERVIGVKSSQTLYQEHLYELHGFKVFLGTDFIEKVLKNEDVEGNKCPIMPRISLKIRGQKQSDILDALKCEIENFDEKGVILKAFDTDKKISLPLFLNLREERLQSDFFSEAGFLGDDGTPEAMDRVAEFFEFRKHYLCNGILEVWASDYNILLGRCDAFVPVNCFVQPEKADEQINNFREEANKRRISAA